MTSSRDRPQQRRDKNVNPTHSSESKGPLPSGYIFTSEGNGVWPSKHRCIPFALLSPPYPAICPLPPPLSSPLMEGPREKEGNDVFTQSFYSVHICRWGTVTLPGAAGFLRQPHFALAGTARGGCQRTRGVRTDSTRSFLAWGLATKSCWVPGRASVPRARS